MLVNLPSLVDVHYETEKLRVATGLRLTALKKAGREDPIMADVHQRLRGIEAVLEKGIVPVITSHEVWQRWAKHIKGVSPVLLAKVMGRCIRIYDGKSDKPCFARSPEGRCGRTDPHSHDIDQFLTPGQLRAHAGLAPGQVRKRGAKLDYDPELKSVCWVIGRQLRFATGKYYEKYVAWKEYYQRKFEAQGIKVVPANLLPKDKRRKRRETDELKSLKHLDNMAFRKMVSLFLTHLWEVWREAEGWPVRRPYAMEYLGHTDYISPWEMMDKQQPTTKGKRARLKRQTNVRGEQ